MDLKLMIIMGIAIVLLLVLFIIANRKGRRQMNFRAFFIIGITWLPIGIFTKNYVLAVMGGAFLAMGLANKKKWKDQPSWQELPPEMRRMKLILMGVLTLILVAGIIVYMIYK